MGRTGSCQPAARRPARRRPPADRRRAASLGGVGRRRPRAAARSMHTRRVVSDPDDKTPLEPDHVYVAPARLPRARRGRAPRALDRRAGAVRAAVDRRAVRVGRGRVRPTRGRHRAHGRERRRRGRASRASRSAAASRSCRSPRPRCAARCRMRRSQRRRRTPILPLEEIPAFLYGLCAMSRASARTSCSSTTAEENLLALEAILEPLGHRLVSVTSGIGGAEGAAARRLRVHPARRPDAGARRLRARDADQAARALAAHPDHLRHRALEGGEARLPRLLRRRRRLHLQADRPGRPALEGVGLRRALGEERADPGAGGADPRAEARRARARERGALPPARGRDAADRLDGGRRPAPRRTSTGAGSSTPA